MIPDTADEYDEIVVALLLADPAQRLRPGVLDVRLIESHLRPANRRILAYRLCLARHAFDGPRSGSAPRYPSDLPSGGVLTMQILCQIEGLEDLWDHPDTPETRYVVAHARIRDIVTAARRDAAPAWRPSSKPW